MYKYLREKVATIILIVFIVGLLPLLPNRTIDPWQLFNPRDFGLLLTTIAAIQFGGYVAIHLFGERLGLAFTGFLGGLVSSTAVFAQLAHTLRTYPESHIATMASGLLASVAMLVDIAIIIFVASPILFDSIIWPMVFMMVMGGIMAMILLHYQKPEKETALQLLNPINLRSILGTSFFIGLMLVLIAIAQRYISMQGVLWVSFLGGLFEVHGISFATALLYLGGQLPLMDARFVIYAAILASFISKIILLWSLTPSRFALQTSLCLLGLLFGGGLVYWLGF